ncbi:unnamed protein product [Boreogadus saida]
MHRALSEVPQIHWDLSTKRILTMEFAEGGQVNDRDYMRRHGINVNKLRCRQSDMTGCTFSLPSLQSGSSPFSSFERSCRPEIQGWQGRVATERGSPRAAVQTLSQPRPYHHAASVFRVGAAPVPAAPPLAGLTPSDRWGDLSVWISCMFSRCMNAGLAPEQKC